MKKPENFKTYKQRGEWVELLFMTRAATHGYNVSRPWGDSTRYDVSVEHEGRFQRVQVKSTSVERGIGYTCFLKRTGIRYYTVEEIDFFAIYIIPADAWYILPARVVLGCTSNICSPPSGRGRSIAGIWKPGVCYAADASPAASAQNVPNSLCGSRKL